jgi:pimeloyl-ACP methyl ester carboxylesterase
LRAFNVPSLVVVGAEDVLLPPSDSEQIAEVLPDSELVVVPGVGHLSPVEAPELVATALSGLIVRVDE